MTRKAIWQSIMLSPSESIRSAARRIQESEIKFLLICDDSGVLLGTVTDGDIRRAVSAAHDLDGRVDTIMNRSPKVAQMGEGIEILRTRMRASVIRHMPRVDQEGRVTDLVLLDSKVNVRQRDSAVLLMAGGRGSRLMPMTARSPKPLLKVGRKPVMERQIDQLIGHGFCRFYIAVNYLGSMIEEHFGDGSRLGVEISYIREDKPMGTAGALSKLPPPRHPLMVMNADIITKADFGVMLEYFMEEGAAITMGVREHQYTIPYGCVMTNGRDVLGIEEKPTFRHLISAGIYVLSPEAVALAPEGSYLDMPDLVQNLINSGRRANSFLITEEWIDIGHKEDLMWAQRLFAVEDEID